MGEEKCDRAFICLMHGGRIIVILRPWYQEVILEEEEPALQPYQHSIDEVIEAYDSDLQSGLSADQVAERQKTYGPNKLK